MVSCHDVLKTGTDSDLFVWRFCRERNLTAFRLDRLQCIMPLRWETWKKSKRLCQSPKEMFTRRTRMDGLLVSNDVILYYVSNMIYGALLSLICLSSKHSPWSFKRRSCWSVSVSQHLSTCLRFVFTLYTILTPHLLQCNMIWYALLSSIFSVKYLVENGANANEITKGGETALWWARKEFGDDHPVVSFLEEIGALEVGPDL